MSNREYVLLIDDDPTVTQGLAALLERADRTTFICGDIESAEIVLTHHPITHVVTDVQFSGAFGFEGLHFLTRLHLERPECRIILMTGYATDDLRATARNMGAAALLSKPFDFSELQSALDSPLEADGDPYAAIEIPGIEELVQGNLLSMAFQPIATLAGEGDDYAFVGFEALTRVRGEWIGNAGELYDYAARRHRLADLNLASFRRALTEAQKLPAHSVLFVNMDPAVFEEPVIVQTLCSIAKGAGFPLSRLVLEITERSALATTAHAAKVFEDLRAEGVRFALDDHGSAYSHLGAIHFIKPSFIKISQSFGTGCETDPTRMRIVRHVAALAKDFGCRTILEGIEAPSTSRAAVENGVDLLQGFHIGRPQPAAHWKDVSPVTFRSAFSFGMEYHNAGRA